MKKISKWKLSEYVIILLIAALLGLLTVHVSHVLNSKATVDSVEADRDLLDLECNTYQDELMSISIDLQESETERIGLEDTVTELEVQIAEMKAEVKLIQEEANRAMEELAYMKERENWYRDIPLDEKYQKYIYDWCNELGLDYNLALAKIKLESQFKVDAVGDNGSSKDFGLCQVNSKNFEWCEELAGREVDVVNNVYDNIECGLRIYKHYQDYWTDLGYTGYELNVRTLNSYNRGIQGYYNYMNQGNSWDDWRYAKLVYKNLDEIE